LGLLWALYESTPTQREERLKMSLSLTAKRCLVRLNGQGFKVLWKYCAIVEVPLKLGMLIPV